MLTWETLSSGVHRSRDGLYVIQPVGGGMWAAHCNTKRARLGCGTLEECMAIAERDDESYIDLSNYEEETV